jgi:deoxyribonuclease V
LLNIPTIGCAKTKLVGDHKHVGPRKGQYQSLYHRGERVGVVLRTRTGVKPIYVSPGHLSDITSSVRLVLRCCNTYRIPEPVRQAHFLANEVRCDMDESS